MLALAATLLTLAAPPVHCDSGATMYVDGPLRVFGKAFHRHEGEQTEVGHTQYACLGRSGPVGIGEDVVTNGTYGAGMEKYVFAGRRYLAVASYDEGEGGGTQYLDVYDVRTRRHRAVNAMLDGAEVPIVRLSANGDLVVDADGAVTAYPFAGGDQVLAAKDASGLAIAGTTVYWTQPDGPRSAALPGAASEETDDVLEPSAFTRANPCDSRPGTTLLRTPKLRVVRSGGKTLACRVGDRRAVAVPGASDLHTAGGRWLYSAAGRRSFVLDMKARRRVTTAPRGVRSTLLGDGALAWIDETGRLQAQRPGAAPVVLESGGASALTSTGTTVYWTSGGAAHSSTA